MPRSSAKAISHQHGDVLTAISDGMVALLKEFYGRGPTRAKSYYEDDLVVCLLRGGFTRVEQTLLEGGRGSSVIQQRMDFQELMRQRFEAVIEAATGRTVRLHERQPAAPRHDVRGLHSRPFGPRRRRRGAATSHAVTARPARPKFGHAESSRRQAAWPSPAARPIYCRS